MQCLGGYGRYCESLRVVGLVVFFLEFPAINNLNWKMCLGIRAMNNFNCKIGSNDLFQPVSPNLVVCYLRIRITKHSSRQIILYSFGVKHLKITSHKKMYYLI